MLPLVSVSIEYVLLTFTLITAEAPSKLHMFRFIVQQAVQQIHDKVEASGVRA